MKKIVLLALAISVCSALAVCVTVNVSSYRVSSLAEENVEALSEDDINSSRISVVGDKILVEDAKNNPWGDGCVSSKGSMCELSKNNVEEDCSRNGISWGDILGLITDVLIAIIFK